MQNEGKLQTTREESSSNAPEEVTEPLQNMQAVLKRNTNTSAEEHKSIPKDNKVTEISHETFNDAKSSESSNLPKEIVVTSRIDKVSSSDLNQKIFSEPCAGKGLELDARPSLETKLDLQTTNNIFRIKPILNENTEQATITNKTQKPTSQNKDFTHEVHTNMLNSK
jgi:hypothetical protein